MLHGLTHSIPSAPPREVLDELDAAARALDELASRAAELVLGMDSETRTLRIVLADDDGSRRLSPRQLFELLAS